MSGVTFLLPGALLPYAAGRRTVVVGPCATVGEALAALGERHPALLDRIVTERGEVRQHVNVFVGSESIRALGGLSASVPDGATVLILPAVSGG